jgi:hypothetical protein
MSTVNNIPIEDVILMALKRILALRKQSNVVAEGSTDETTGSGDTGAPSPDKESIARLGLVLKFRQSRLWELLSRLLNSSDPAALKELIKYLKENLSEETLKTAVKALSEKSSKPIAMTALAEIMNKVDAHFRNIATKEINPSAKKELDLQTKTTTYKTPTPLPLEPKQY